MARLVVRGSWFVALQKSTAGPADNNDVSTRSRTAKLHNAATPLHHQFAPRCCGEVVAVRLTFDFLHHRRVCFGGVSDDMYVGMRTWSMWRCQACSTTEMLREPSAFANKDPT